ncbi:MAG: hypothetical protein P4L93_10230 [Coriobacteriia bacterium]|nr:hypothetical protein [Coriobacteriia bacterium]
MWLHSDSLDDFTAEAEAGITWVSGSLRWSRVTAPALMAVLGVACVAIADALARQGALGTTPLWWLGVLAIFAPAAATLFFVRVSRTEAIFILVLVALALYAVKLTYAPGMLWGYDELLHFRTADNILTTGRLFTHNSLLEVSPYYPGMELVTAALVRVTGLTIVQAGLLLVGLARLLTVLAIFLLLERVAQPSRFAAPAALLYMASPAFIYFDSMFAYESLALGLSLVCVFVLHAAQLEEGARRRRLNGVGALLLLAVVITHHVTSFILVAALVLWTLASLWSAQRKRSKQEPGERADARSRKRRVFLSDLPGSGWVPIVGVVAVLVWLLNIAEVAISYLTPQILSGFTEIVRIIHHEGTSRQLFQSAAGHTAPLLERAIGIGSVLLILVLIPIGMKYLWERRHSNVLSHALAIGALGYPVILALRLTQSGWDVASRATAFVYVPLAFAIAAGLEPLVARYIRANRLGALAVVVVATVIFAGGIVAGTSPVTRQPSVYSPGVAEVPYDIESVAAANWEATTLGAGHRIAADSASGVLSGSLGRQEMVSQADNVSVSELFLSPGFGAGARQVVRDGRVEYVVVDRRIAGAAPLKGFIYEPWEKQVVDYGSSVSSETVNKFDTMPKASKVFDSGNVELFAVQGLLR